MHPAWSDYTVFAADVRAEIGEPPSDNHQLDRINTDGNYEPGNLRWVTAKENTRNRRNNILLTWDGRTQCLSAWAEEKGWGRHVISARRKLGWTTEEIMTTPIGTKAGGWERKRKTQNSH